MANRWTNNEKKRSKKAGDRNEWNNKCVRLFRMHVYACVCIFISLWLREFASHSWFIPSHLHQSRFENGIVRAHTVLFEAQLFLSLALFRRAHFSHSFSLSLRLGSSYIHFVFPSAALIHKHTHEHAGKQASKHACSVVVVAAAIAANKAIRCHISWVTRAFFSHCFSYDCARDTRKKQKKATHDVRLVWWYALAPHTCTRSACSNPVYEHTNSHAHTLTFTGLWLRRYFVREKRDEKRREEKQRQQRRRRQQQGTEAAIYNSMLNMKK